MYPHQPMPMVWQQYHNAYPTIHYQQPPSAANGYGWHGNGYGWQLDPKAWHTPPIYPTLKDEVVEEPVIQAEKVEKQNAWDLSRPQIPCYGSCSRPSSPCSGLSSPCSRPSSPCSRPSSPCSRPSSPCSRPSSPCTPCVLYYPCRPCKTPCPPCPLKRKEKISDFIGTGVPSTDKDKGKDSKGGSKGGKKGEKGKGKGKGGDSDGGADKGNGKGKGKDKEKNKEKGKEGGKEKGEKDDKGKGGGGGGGGGGALASEDGKEDKNKDDKGGKRVSVDKESEKTEPDKQQTSDKFSPKETTDVSVCTPRLPPCPCANPYCPSHLRQNRSPYSYNQYPAAKQKQPCKCRKQQIEIPKETPPPEICCKCGKKKRPNNKNKPIKNYSSAAQNTQQTYGKVVQKQCAHFISCLTQNDKVLACNVIDLLPKKKKCKCRRQ